MYTVDRNTELPVHYRYYREDQLPTAGRIAALKDMGFSLADIVRMLEAYDDRERLESFFSDRRAELEAQAQDTAHVKFRTLPEVTVASCTYKGSYTLITEVYAAVVAWIEANGYEPSGAMFNIYHVSPHETQNPDEFVTEICYPVKRRG